MFLFQAFKIFFFIAGIMYIIYLLLLMLKAYTELRLMPYFGENNKKILLEML